MRRRQSKPVVPARTAHRHSPGELWQVQPSALQSDQELGDRHALRQRQDHASSEAEVGNFYTLIQERSNSNHETKVHLCLISSQIFSYSL